MRPMRKRKILEPRYENGRVTFEGANYQPNLGDRVIALLPWIAIAAGLLALAFFVARFA